MALLASGQLTSSGSAAQLTSQAVSPKKWVIKALASNNSAVGIGPAFQPSGAALSTSNAFMMEAGDFIEVDRTVQPGTLYDLNPSDIYVIGSGGVVTWLAFE